MKTLLIVDVQRDFCPGGSLAVNDGDTIVPTINRLIAGGDYDLIVATKDWHPEGHVSFESLWPVHCVQGSTGADFHPDLHSALIDRTIYKGSDQQVDSYSGFWDNNHAKETSLKKYIDWRAVDLGKDPGKIELDVCGLALDFCVKFTALDAVAHGYTTHLIADATRSVFPENDVHVLRELVASGVGILSSEMRLSDRARGVNAGDEHRGASRELGR